MPVDIFSFALLVIIVNILQGAGLFIQFLLNREHKGLGWWLLWCLSIAAGLTFMLLRVFHYFEKPAIFLQYTLIIHGLIFLYIGILKFLGRNINRALFFVSSILTIIVFLTFTFILDSVYTRSLILTSAVVILASLKTYTLLKYRYKSIKITANIFAGILILHGIFFIIRFLAVVQNPAIGNYLSKDQNTLILYTDALVAGLLVTFCLILMVNQKLIYDTKEAKEHFELIFNTSPDAIVISRLEDSLIKDINTGFTEIIGYSREEAIGKTSFELNLWKNPSDRKKLIDDINNQGRFDNHEFLFQKKEGTEIIILSSGNTVDISGEKHIISIIKDITKKKQTELELKIKNEELENANKEKDKLFSIISHDMRNAFNIFLGYSNILYHDLNTLTKEEIKLIAKNLYTTSQNFYKLLTNLLDWSAAKRGLFKINLEIVNLDMILNEVININEPISNNKEIKLIKSFQEGINLKTDVSVLKVILRNLISNAIKFTERGGSVVISSEKQSDNKIKICVKDTGIGMNKEMLEDIFNISKKTNRKGTENEPSTGLGLTLVKEYTKKLNGTITVESTENNGSTFCILIPDNMD